jgi:hypothetical protein
MVDQVKQETARQYTGDLTGEWPATIRGSSYQIQTRETYSGAPIQQATYYVGDHMTELGVSVEYHDWGPDTAPNVIGQLTGASRPGDIYMITAHLDNLSDDETAPGADDNASGAVAVLVAADVLSQFDWDCTLRFALWTGEEQGLLGSDKYAKRSLDNGEKIVGVLNLDMIAWNTPGSTPEIDLHAKSSMTRTVDLANQAASVVDTYDIALVPEVRTDGTGSSDHASFWKYKFDAILGIEDYYPNGHDFSPYYHQTTDVLSTLDMGYFAEYVKLAVAETAHMAGCLTTGTLQGQISGSHDNSPIANAEVILQYATSRVYTLRTGAGGLYSQAVPPSSYSETASAYGYDTSTATGVLVSAGAWTTQDVVLSASAPAATNAAVALVMGEAGLTWSHVAPDTSYEVHRSTDPYFTAVAGTWLATLEANHAPSAAETLTYRDTGSGVGDASMNDFYLVLGMNAAGIAAVSNRAGEFDFSLIGPVSQ